MLRDITRRDILPSDGSFHDLEVTADALLLRKEQQTVTLQIQGNRWILTPIDRGVDEMFKWQHIRKHSGLQKTLAEHENIGGDLLIMAYVMALDAEPDSEDSLE
jgi:hypothetical protein